MEGLISFLMLCVGILVQITHSHGSMMTCLPKKHAALFIFGDSLFDNGNNNYINTTADYQANFPPYGETFFKYPNGRFSDGRMIPDAVAEYADLPLLPPYLHPGNPDYIYGVNFASGGSGALRETAQGSVVDLHTQASYLKNVKKLFKQRLGNGEAEELLSKSVYLFSVGANDYGTLLNPNSSVLLPVDKQEFVDMVIGNLSDVIKEIHNLGGRKFGFVNVPSIGCVPAVRIIWGNGSECFEEFSAMGRLHNDKLSKMLQKLEEQLKGFKYSVFDFYSTFSQVRNNPSKYGLKEVNAGCCGGGAFRGDQSCGGMRGIKEYELCENVNEHLFWDSNHLSDRGSEIFGEWMWNGNRTVAMPYNLKELFEH